MARCEKDVTQGEIYILPVYGKVMSSQVAACVDFYIYIHVYLYIGYESCLW